MTLELKATPGQAQQEHPAGDQSSQSPTFIEKRRETRYPTNDLVEISIREGGTQRLAGTILDVSRSGLRIEVATPITKGIQLEVLVPTRAIIFGETRYCHRSSRRYHVGVAIEDVYFAQPLPGKHIHDDQFGLYLVGKGLTAPEAIHVKNHLAACKACRDRLAETETILHPERKSTS